MMGVMCPPDSSGPAVLERALISVAVGQEEPFEAAFSQAKEAIATADGFRWLELHRGIERPGVYLLLVGWDSIEAHTTGFRGSDRFLRWRELIGPYFAAPPDVEHYRPVVTR
jgi:heme-degrading monooxygenase HmoA